MDQGFGKGTAEVSRLCSTGSGNSAGKTQRWGWQQLGPDPEKERHTLSHTCHLRSQLGLLARAPTRSISKQSLCFFTAWLGSRGKCPKTHLPLMAVWGDQESYCHRNKYKTGQPYQKQPSQVSGKWPKIEENLRSVYSWKLPLCWVSSITLGFLA